MREIAELVDAALDQAGLRRAGADDRRALVEAGDALDQREAGFVLPFGDRRRRGVGDDHDRRADHRGDVRGAGQRGVIAIDRRRLRDVKRLAGGDIGEVVDDDDAADEIDRGQLARQRAADIARAKDHGRRHAAYSIVHHDRFIRRSQRRMHVTNDLDHRRHARDRLRGRGGACFSAGDHVAITGTRADGVVKAEHALSRDRQRRRWPASSATCGMRRRLQRAVETAVAKFGGIDVLVNSAGVGVGVPIAEMPHDEWDRIIGTNLTGVFNCCKAAIPHLRARGGGWIVNISSLASTNPFPGGAAYCASKAGLNAFSEALMQELRYDNIRVTTCCPGSVATGFSGREPGSGADWKLLPEDVAQAIVDVLNHPRAQPAEPHRNPALAAEEMTIVLRAFYERATNVLRSECGGEDDG